MLAELASNSVIDTAYVWLCHQRRDWPADTDIWHLRFRWAAAKPQLQGQLSAGTYRFSSMDRVSKANGEVVHVWSSLDALLLKALSIVLAKVLPVSLHCTHVKGHGGAKAAVRLTSRSTVLTATPWPPIPAARGLARRSFRNGSRRNPASSPSFLVEVLLAFNEVRRCQFG